MKSVFIQATVFALGRSLLYLLYSAGYYFGAFLVVQGRTNYDNIFRFVTKHYVTHNYDTRYISV